MRGRGALTSAVVVLGALRMLGCEDTRAKAGTEAGPSNAAQAGAGASAGSSARGAASAPAGAHASGSTSPSAPADRGPPCKVMSSEGGPSATADATRWLELPAKANFTVRTLATGRELRFEGPGRVRACGDDVALVAAGAAIGLPGSGEAPGAEQWAATACGVARWASGVHRLSGGANDCTLHSSLGTAQLWLADDVRAEELPGDAGKPDASTRAAGVTDGGPGASPWLRIDAKRALRLHAPRPLDSAGAVKGALASCESAAEVVENLVARMSAADAGAGGVGELAARSVGSRGLARAACAVAAVRVTLAGSREADQARLAAANARWRAPRQASGGSGIER